LANHKSALKRIRQNKKRRLRNRIRKTRIKNLVKAVEAAVADKAVDTAEEKLRMAQKVIDKTSSKGTLHWRTAARKVARLSKKVAALKKAAS